MSGPMLFCEIILAQIGGILITIYDSSGFRFFCWKFLLKNKQNLEL